MNLLYFYTLRENLLASAFVFSSHHINIILNHKTDCTFIFIFLLFNKGHKLLSFQGFQILFL